MIIALLKGEFVLLEKINSSFDSTLDKYCVVGENELIPRSTIKLLGDFNSKDMERYKSINISKGTNRLLEEANRIIY